MGLLAPNSFGVLYRHQIIRTIYGRCRIGCRDVVGFGINGGCNYKDDPIFPFPAIRFKENSKDICALREKEKGDWRQLCCEEKKALYRASFCQTFAEFQAPTGQWKFVLGWWFVVISFGFWAMIFCHYYVFEPLPTSLSKAYQKAQLRRMLEIRTNPIDGISSKWDYDNDRWKVAIVLAIIGMTLANPVPPLGLASLAYPVYPPGSYSTVINHGITIPKVVVPIAPIIKTPVILSSPWLGLGWGKHY